MGVLKTLRELDDRDADCVMLSIEYLTEALTDDPNPSLSQRIPRVMLNHLYELHKLRDHDIYNAVAFSFIEDAEVKAFKRHQEMYCDA